MSNHENVDVETKKDVVLKKQAKVKWSIENEEMLVEWCDIGQCYKWLHMRAHMSYSRKQAWFTIPAIILSTVSGTASFAQESIPVKYQSLATMMVGTINISVGILTTIQQYLKISELNESHRISSIGWDKFARNIRIELAKTPDERMSAGDFLKFSRDEFDKLMEISPFVPDLVIDEFKKKVKEGGDDNISNRPKKGLVKPDIMNIITSVEEKRHHWYKGVNKSERETEVDDDLVKRLADIRQKELEIHDKEIELKVYADTLTNERDETNSNNNLYIQQYIDTYRETNGRDPEKDDIYEHFAGSINSEYIDWFLTTDGCIV
jgi:hypothetical protein